MYCNEALYTGCAYVRHIWGESPPGICYYKEILPKSSQYSWPYVDHAAKRRGRSESLGWFNRPRCAREWFVSLFSPSQLTLLIVCFVLHALNLIFKWTASCCSSTPHWVWPKFNRSYKGMFACGVLDIWDIYSLQSVGITLLLLLFSSHGAKQKCAVIFLQLS